MPLSVKPSWPSRPLLTLYLTNCSSTDAAIRSAAEQQLSQAAEADFVRLPTPLIPHTAFVGFAY